MEQSDSPPAGIDGVPVWWFALRAAWVAVQLVLTYYVGQAGATFFYQAF